MAMKDVKDYDKVDAWLSGIRVSRPSFSEAPPAKTGTGREIVYPFPEMTWGAPPAGGVRGWKEHWFVRAGNEIRYIPPVDSRIFDGSLPPGRIQCIRDSEACPV